MFKLILQKAEEPEINLPTSAGSSKKQNGCLKRPYKYLGKEEKQKAKRKGEIYPFECRVPKTSKER